MADHDTSNHCGPIVCGTDFSERSEQAAALAWAMAHSKGVSLHLVHAHDEGHSVGDALEAAAARLGEGVIPEGLPGHPDEVLVERAAQLSASLLVVGSLGRRHLADWLLGSTAERVVRCAQVPCLVVREPATLSQWLQGHHRLKAMLAVSMEDPVQPCLDWLGELAELAPLDLFAVQVAGGPHLNDAWYESEVDRLQRACGLPRADCHVEVAQWSVEEHLLTVATREKANLIIMGRHLRSGLERLWRGSVSMAVLKRSDLSVACIPALAPVVAARV